MKSKGKNKIERTKDFRKDGYNKVDDPLLNLGSTFPRNINIDEFAQSRAHELNHFVNVIKEKYYMKAIAQKIPKHMRRRTTSHNYYRIPFRLRYKFMQLRVKDPKANSAGNRSRCRKHMRRPTTMINQFTQRSVKCRWLQTHIWHAKRMKMRSLWGYKLAYKRNDKSLRCMYRFAKEDCCLYDKSYYDIIEVQNASQYLANFIKDADVLSGVKEGYIELNCTNHITPISFIVSPETNKAWLLVHPTDTEGVLGITKIEKGSVLNKSYYELYGRKSVGTLMRVLAPLIEGNEEVLKYLEGARENMCIIPNHTVIGLNISKPNSNFRMNERILNKIFTEQYVAPKTTSTKIDISSYLDFNRHIQSNMLWKEPAIAPQIEYETGRSKISHRKKLKQSMQSYYDKLTKLKNTPPNVPEMNLVRHKDQENKVGIILIIQHGTGKSNIGCNIKILLNSGFQIWRRLIYAGAKAIGIKELKHIYHEQAKVFYPFEDVRSLCYSQYCHDKALSKMLKYYRKPPQKRIDNYLNQIKYPFCPVWKDCADTMNDLIPIIIHPKKGVPHSGSALFATNQISLPQDAKMPECQFNRDFELFTGKSKNQLYGNTKMHKPRNSKKRQLINEILGKSISHKMMTDDVKQTIESKVMYFDTDFRVNVESPKPIGFIIYGGYSYILGHGVGIGYINKAAFKTDLKSMTVFIKNKTKMLEGIAYPN